MTEQELLCIFDLLIERFRLKGIRESYSVIKTGNINDTFVLRTKLPDGSNRQYAVQRINHEVFRRPEQVAGNAFAVTEHIRQKLCEQGVGELHRYVLHYYRMDNGKFFLQRPDGSYWRVFSYVYDALNVSEANDTLLHGTGVAFGRFQRLLTDFPAEKLQETIPHFHDTPKRFADLHRSVKADVCGRASEVQEELAWLFSMEPRVRLLEDLHREGKLPLRVVHNDTKCNNVMFDRETLQPLAVIDLDTVMPGFVAYDFGDAVRFACNTAAEDEEDVTRVQFDLHGFRCFAEGFLQELNGYLTETELETLADSALLITLELSTRFLKDYLDGDVYFKCRKERHNLHRARCQIALGKDILHKISEMKKILNAISVQKNEYC